MEQYRDKLKLQNNFLLMGSIILFLCAIFAIGSELGVFNLLHPSGDSHWNSTWFGYLTGISCGLGGVMIAGFIRNRRALKDHNKLKVLYVKEHDERTQMVTVFARNTAMQFLLILGLVSSVVAGYFNAIVSTTILACTFVSSVTAMGFLWYYNKKF